MCVFCILLLYKSEKGSARVHASYSRIVLRGWTLVISGSGLYIKRAAVGISRPLYMSCRVTFSSMLTKMLSVSPVVLHIDRTLVLQYIHT